MPPRERTLSEGDALIEGAFTETGLFNPELEINVSRKKELGNIYPQRVFYETIKQNSCIKQFDLRVLLPKNLRLLMQKKFFKVVFSMHIACKAFPMR